MSPGGRAGGDSPAARGAGDSASAAEDGPALRDAVIATARAMNAAGINVNKSGNVSARCTRGRQAGFVVTPTAVPYAELSRDDLVFVSLAGRARGAHAPSTEWRFHRDIYAARPEFGAVVHTHSPHATALACHGHGLPAFHYMVAAAGGDDVRCAPYATFGTQALSDHALAALDGRRACLLAHHGVIACGTALEHALTLAVEIEHLARVYLAARTLGEPPRLSAAEMARVLAQFEGYGAA
jgi:L-fuculose-phosphate aldolase